MFSTISERFKLSSDCAVSKIKSRYALIPVAPLPLTWPSSINIAAALRYDKLSSVDFVLIFSRVFAPTPRVGLEIERSKAGLSELLKITRK